MSVSLSNQVCDNLRIDETSVHTIIVIYGEALHSLFYSQGRSLVRKESATHFIPQCHISSYEEPLANIVYFFDSCNIIDNNCHFLASPGTFPYSSLKHLVKYEGEVKPTL